MNHLPAFHKLRIKLENEVRALQAKNYFGDGMYSAGKRLGDSAVVTSELSAADIPEFIVRPPPSVSNPNPSISSRLIDTVLSL